MSRMVTTGLAVRGLAWSFLSTFWGKAAALVSQFALGHLLVPETYGVFAIAATALSLVAGFQNAGVSKYLIQKQSEFDLLVADYAAFSIYLGAIGGVLLALGAVGLAALYDMPQLILLLAISALSLPLASLTACYTAKLGVAFEFGKLQRGAIVLSVSHNLCLIAFAYLGAEHLSIAIATLFSTCVAFGYYVAMAGHIAPRLRLGLGPFARIFASLRWLVLISFLFGLMRNGDYFVLGLTLDRRDVGLYYFGFMLTANIGVLLTTPINQTFLPIFASQLDNPDRLHDMIDRSGGLIGVVCAVLCLVAVGLAPHAVHGLWGGKWDAAILTAMVMAVGLPLRVCATLATVIVEATGRWRLRAGLLVADAAGVMAAALLGSLLGGYEMAAICVAIEQALTGLLLFPLAARLVGMSLSRCARLLATTALPFLVCAAALWLVNARFAGDLTSGRDLMAAIGFTAVAAGLCLAAATHFNRGMLGTLRQMGRGGL